MTPDHILIPWIVKKLGVAIERSRIDGSWFTREPIFNDHVDFNPFTGDWMVKGMDVLFATDPHWLCRMESGEVDLYHTESEAYYAMKREPNLSLPRAFWECWYQVEKGEQG